MLERFEKNRLPLIIATAAAVTIGVRAFVSPTSIVLYMTLSALFAALLIPLVILALRDYSWAVVLAVFFLPFRVHASLPWSHTLNASRLFMLLALLNVVFDKAGWLKARSSVHFLDIRRLGVADWLLGGCFILLLASGVWVGDFNAYLSRLPLLLEIILLVVLVRWLNPTYLRRLTVFILVAAVVVITVGLAQVALQANLPFSRAASSTRVLARNYLPITSFFYNRNNLGLFLVLILPLAMALVGSGKSSDELLAKELSLPGRSLLALLILTGCPAIIAMIASRAGLLGLSAVTLGFLLAGRTGLRRKLLVAFLIVIAFAGAAQFSLRFQQRAWTSIAIIEEGEVVGEEDISSALVRYQLTIAGARMIARAPLLGIGVGGFEENVLRAMPKFVLGRPHDAHNFWLEIAAAGGIIGFVLFFSVFTLAVLRLLKQHRRTGGIYYLWIFLAMIGFIFACLGPSNMYTGLTFFWPMLGLALILINLNKHLEKGGQGSSENLDPFAYVS